jgi:hypothetical protein
MSRNYEINMSVPADTKFVQVDVYDDDLIGKDFLYLFVFLPPLRTTDRYCSGFARIPLEDLFPSTDTEKSYTLQKRKAKDKVGINKQLYREREREAMK